jgi:hypothetical protein
MSSVKDGHNSNDGKNNSSKKQKSEETQEEIVLEVIKDPALGKTIDISG